VTQLANLGIALPHRMSDRWLTDVTLFGTAKEVRDGVGGVARDGREDRDRRTILHARRPDGRVRGIDRRLSVNVGGPDLAPHTPNARRVAAKP